MAPEQRRRQIIDAARPLMEARADVSTADVAAAAGVTRSLVHHYFRGIDDIRDAVILDIAQALRTSAAPGPDGPVRERLDRNLDVLLDLLQENRHLWLATLSARGDDADHSRAATMLRQTLLERMVVNNGDLIDDTPWARLCLDGYLGFCSVVCRQWVLDQATREEVKAALYGTLLHLLLETIPSGPSPSGPPRPGAGPDRHRRRGRVG